MFRRANAGDPKRSNPHEHGLSGYAAIVQPRRASAKSSAVVHVLVAMPAVRPQAAPPPVRTRFTTWDRMIELRVRLFYAQQYQRKKRIVDSQLCPLQGRERRGVHERASARPFR